MAFRALSSCSRVTPRIAGRAYYSTQPSHVGFISPVLIDTPKPILGEYRSGIPPATGSKNTPRAVKVSTLPNGLRVATLTSNDIGVSLGLFVGVGSRNESRSNAGATHLLKFAAFNSTASKPGYQIVREIESAGATFSASAGREHLLFSSEVLPNHVDTLVPIISDFIHPSLPYHEVRAQKEEVKKEAERLEADPVASFFELVHRQAYRNRGLGQSLIALKDNIHHINQETVAKFVHEHYTYDQSVFVGVGVDHETLVNGLSAALGSGKETPKKQEAPPASKYLGGETHVPTSGHSQVGIAFEGASYKGDVKESLALGVLQHVLGAVLGGVNISAQVGSGVTSRLATNVLPNNPNAVVISAFNFSYSDSGLFGVYAETADAPGRLLTAVVGELSKLANSSLSNEEINKAKALYKLSVLDQGSKRTPALEFIGAQVLASSKAVTPEEYAAQIDSLTAEDVSHVAKKVFSSRPTLVAVGDVANLPPYEEIVSSLSNK